MEEKKEKLEYRWYAMRVVSGKEIKVRDYLEKLIQSAPEGKYISKVVVPTTKVIQMKGGKKITKEKPLYGGFVFLEMHLNSRLLDFLRTIDGYRGFLVDKNNNPVPMPQSDVNRILAQIGEITLEEEPAVEFVVGEKVKIIDGPLANFVGEIAEINQDRKMVKVEIKIFGRKTPVELSLSQIEKIG